MWQLVRGQKQEGVGRMNWSKRRSAPWLLLMLRCDRMNNYSQILLVPPVMWKWKKYNLVNKRFPVDVLGESEKRDLWYWRYSYSLFVLKCVGGWGGGGGDCFQVATFPTKKKITTWVKQSVSAGGNNTFPSHTSYLFELLRCFLFSQRPGTKHILFTGVIM